MMQLVQASRGSKLRWRPSPLIAASMLLHAAAGVVVVMQPDAWPIALFVIACNHLLLAIAGLIPRSALLGPNWSRLPPASIARNEVALTIDDGPDPQVTPQVLDILELHGAKATFFCVGNEGLRFPALCREIVRRGHAIENHSQTHRAHFAAFGPRRTALDIDQAQLAVAMLTDQAPRFFRPTAGLRSVFLEPVLAQRGLQLVSWTRRGFDTIDPRADHVYRRLARNLASGDILLVHDGNAARTVQGTPVILEVLPRLLDAVREAGLHCVTLRSAIP